MTLLVLYKNKNIYEKEISIWKFMQDQELGAVSEGWRWLTWIKHLKN